MLSGQLATRPCDDHVLAVQKTSGHDVSPRRGGWLYSAMLFLSSPDCRELDADSSPESKPFPLHWPVGNTILGQEVSGRTVGHVTAAAAERHVGTRGGENGQLHTQKYFFIY